MSIAAIDQPERRAAPPPGPRRRASRHTWLCRVVLAIILIAQAALSLRVRNSAFEDEALYLYAGRLELAHLLHGAPLIGSFASYFAGAPVLYPVLAGALDSVGGLAAARVLSLVEMLAVTALLYAMTRQLFNERVGLCAAAVFAGTEAAIFLGYLATFDATSLFLLAAAAWIVVRTASWRWPGYLLAAPVGALACAVKYAGLLFIPTVAVLAALAAWPYRGRLAALRPPLLIAATGGILFAALRAAGPGYLAAIAGTTTNRAHGSTAAWTLLHDAVLWGGVPVVLALIGTIAYARRPRTEPGELIAPAGGRLRRALLGATLAGTALLAPAYQLHLHTAVSFHKHIGFGLFFAAPMAGIGLARIIGDHFRRVQIGIVVWAGALTLGMIQAGQLANGWPQSAGLVAALDAQARPGAHYLVEADEVPIYYLMSRNGARPGQFTSTYTITYADRRGRVLTSDQGFSAAIRDRYFRVIAYDYSVTPGLDQLLARQLEAGHAYRLAAVVPEHDSAGRALYDANGRAFYYVWVRVGPPPGGGQHRSARQRSG